MIFVTGYFFDCKQIVWIPLVLPDLKMWIGLVPHCSKIKFSGSPVFSKAYCKQKKEVLVLPMRSRIKKSFLFCKIKDCQYLLSVRNISKKQADVISSGANSKVVVTMLSRRLPGCRGLQLTPLTQLLCYVEPSHHRLIENKTKLLILGTITL